MAACSFPDVPWQARPGSAGGQAGPARIALRFGLRVRWSLAFRAESRRGPLGAPGICSRLRTGEDGTMRTTVYFATNRQANPQATDPAERFAAAMAPPGQGRLSWGRAFVEETDPDSAVLRTGRVDSIEGISGDFF